MKQLAKFFLQVSPCGVSRVLQLSNSTIREILHLFFFKFPYRFQHILVLQEADMQQRLNFENEFLIWQNEDVGRGPFQIFVALISKES